MSWQDKTKKEYTEIHNKVIKLVRELGYAFETEKPIGFDAKSGCVPDIVVNSEERGDLIIHVHGFKWHSSPTKSRSDSIKDARLRAMGKKVIKIWDFQIKVKNYDWIKEVIKQGYKETHKEHMARVGTDLLMI